MNGNGAAPQSSDWTQLTLKQLKDRASVDKTEMTKYAPKRWVNVIDKLYKEGDKHKLLNHPRAAYYHYLRGCNVLIEILNRHPNLSQVQGQPLYIQLLNRTSDEILGTLYDLNEEIEPQQSKQEDQRIIAPDENVDIEHVLKKYPAITGLGEDTSTDSSKHEISSLDDLLPSAPTHKPHAGGRVPTPEPRPQITRKPVPFTPPQLRDYEQTSRLPQALPVPQPYVVAASDHPNSNKKNLGYALQLPGLTNFNFPKTMVVDPEVLARWIAKKPNQPSVLLLDVRPLSMYEHASIRHKWVCQIEPLVLRSGVTSDKIQTSLTMSNDVQQELFKRRNEFDLIVYYDQDSKKLDGALEPLQNLRRAIYEDEFIKILPRVPMMLAGGFSAWHQIIGDRGVVVLTPPKTASRPLTTGPPAVDNGNDSYVNRATTAAPIKDQLSNHWLRNIVGKGPSGRDEHVYSSTFEYFKHKQNPQGISSPTVRPEGRVPPLQGTFANSLDLSPQDAGGLPITMPIAQPNISSPSSGNTSGAYPSEPVHATNYPEVRPNQSGAFALRRQNTYIDNPFNGFTETKNDLYEVPPIPPKPRIPSHSPPPPPPPPHAAEISPPTHPSSAPPQPVTRPVPPVLPVKPIELMTSQRMVTDPRQAPVSDSSISQLGSVVIGTTGLKNLGNTCFMNSIVQCLSGTIPLARYLISGTYKRDVNKSNPLGTGGVLAQSFADLLRTMWSGSYSFISPVTFREALGRFAPQFAGTDQQDSQEFLLFLLDGLHEDINLVTERPSPQPESPEEEDRFERLPDWEASAIAWAKYMERNRSIIVDLFQGQYRSRLTCLTCKHTSTTYNTFMSLSLPIPKGKSAVSLYQCLDMFVKEEILEDDDAWHCPRCKALRRSTKLLTLSRLPVVLLIHLKRFSFDGPFHNKLETMVKYPARDLDLSRYIPDTMCPPDTRERAIHRYDLYGVSNHYGSLTAGHYTSCVRNGYRQEWHYFDDTRFSVCDEDKAVGRAAYNLFYVRSTVK